METHTVTKAPAAAAEVRKEAKTQTGREAMATTSKEIWIDGEFRPWADANVHVMTHTLHYGLGVFEGIRAYQGATGNVAVFRLAEHIDRLFDSAKVARMEIPFEPETLVKACLESIRVNDLKDCYLRPLAFYSDGEVGLGAVNPVRVSISSFPWGTYLGKDGLEKGIRAKISTLSRQHLGSNFLRAKICGQYTTSILAKREALREGYQEAIFLDSNGYCTEGTGENLFMIKDGVLKTPPERSAILPGITRNTVLTLARDHAEELGIEIREESFARDELLLADEVFLTGTAAEVTPIREVGGSTIGEGGRGPITTQLQKKYFDAVAGKIDKYRDWLAPVE